MLLMTGATIVHHHAESAPVENSCDLCIHHIHHGGHLTAQNAGSHDCLICQLTTLPFLAATVLTVVRPFAVHAPVYSFRTPALATVEAGNISTRAPPVVSL